MVKENPVDRLEFTKIVRDQTEVLTPETVEKLLRDAMDNDLALIPFLDLAFYAGIRPDGELQKVLWSDIDLNAKKHHVTIRPTVAKKRRKRWIDLSDNALAWLWRVSRPRAVIWRAASHRSAPARCDENGAATPWLLGSPNGHSKAHDTPGVHAGWLSTATSTVWSSRPAMNRRRSCGITTTRRSLRKLRPRSGTYSRRPREERRVVPFSA